MSYTTSKSSDYLPIYHPSLFNNPETQKRVQQSNAYVLSSASSSQSYSAIHSSHVGGSGSFSHYYFNSGGSSIIR